MCRIDSCDPADVWNDEQRRARKPYPCCDCGRTIDKAEHHQVSTYLLDGRWERYRTCAHCWVGRDWLMAVCNGWCVTDIGEEIGEHWDEEPQLRSHTMGRFIVGHRNRWAGGRMPLPCPITIPAGVTGR